VPILLRLRKKITTWYYMQRSLERRKTNSVKPSSTRVCKLNGLSQDLQKVSIQKKCMPSKQYCRDEDISEDDSMPPALLSRDHDYDAEKERNMNKDALIPPLVPRSNLEMEENSDDNPVPPLVPRRRGLTNGWDSDDKSEDEFLAGVPDVQIKKETMNDDTSIQMLIRVEDTNDEVEDLKEGM
jgi:hypothetical protein